MTARRIWLAFAAVLLALFAPLSIAKADGLYDAPVPAGSSYVRFLNADVAAETGAALDGRAIDFGSLLLTPYQLVPAGEHALTTGKATEVINVAAGAFYTVALHAEGPKSVTVIEDEAITNPAFAKLFFYNFTDTAAGLLADVGGDSVRVFSDLGAARTAAREVQPFDVVFSVTVGGDQLEPLERSVLQRHVGTSIFVVEHEGQYVADIAENSVSR